MTVMNNLPLEIERKLELEAQRRGTGIEDLVAALLTEALQPRRDCEIRGKADTESEASRTTVR